jgi:hypothetical protein
MPPRRHSADPRGRRRDLGIGVRDMAAGLGVGMEWHAHRDLVAAASAPTDAIAEAAANRATGGPLAVLESIDARMGALPLPSARRPYLD